MNQLLATGYAYDANGNTILRNGATLAYDVTNHLTQLGTTFAAGYTGAGLRAWRTTDGVTTYYLYDGTLPVCEYQLVDDAPTLSAVNTFGPTGLLARNESGGLERWYQFDAEGNVAERLDAQGAVLSADVYDAYGLLLAGGDVTDPFGYKGQVGYYTDHATGLILCTFRYYDPALGRWLTEDPIGYAGGVNVYGYCGGEPVHRLDPLGLHWDDWQYHWNSLRVNWGIDWDHRLKGKPVLSSRQQLQTAQLNGGASHIGQDVLNDPSMQQIRNLAHSNYVVYGFMASGGGVSPKWPFSRANPPASELQNGCESKAQKIFNVIGGKIVTIRPKYNAPQLGEVSNRSGELISGWTYHKAVVLGNRVFDGLTGPLGMTISEYKRLYKYADAIDFGF